MAHYLDDVLSELTFAPLHTKTPRTKPGDLTSYAMEGWFAVDARQGLKSPHLSTSNADSAWHIGVWLNQTGRSAPRDVRASRGDTFHVNGMKVRMDWVQGCTEIERIG